MNPVIEMTDDEIETMAPPGGDQKIEECHRIGPPGDRDKHPAAPQLEALQVGDETIEQVHARKLT
jgi:hypothetical protein